MRTNGWKGVRNRASLWKSSLWNVRVVPQESSFVLPSRVAGPNRRKRAPGRLLDLAKQVMIKGGVLSTALEVDGEVLARDRRVGGGGQKHDQPGRVVRRPRSQSRQ